MKLKTLPVRRRTIEQLLKKYPTKNTFSLLKISFQ